MATAWRRSSGARPVLAGVRYAYTRRSPQCRGERMEADDAAPGHVALERRPGHTGGHEIPALEHRSEGKGRGGRRQPIEQTGQRVGHPEGRVVLPFAEHRPDMHHSRARIGDPGVEDEAGRYEAVAPGRVGIGPNAERSPRRAPAVAGSSEGFPRCPRSRSSRWTRSPIPAVPSMTEWWISRMNVAWLCSSPVANTIPRAVVRSRTRWCPRSEPGRALAKRACSGSPHLVEVVGQMHMVPSLPTGPGTAVSDAGPNHPAMRTALRPPGSRAAEALPRGLDPTRTIAVLRLR